MRIATIAWQGSTSAAIVTTEGVFPARSGGLRDDAKDVAALIEAPLTAADLAAVTAGVPLSPDEVTFLPPVLRPPKNILCVGKNYIEHVREGARAEGLTDHSAPKLPVWFTKPATAQVGAGAGIVRDAEFTAALDYEGELGIIIGKAGKGIRPEDVGQHIFGYSIVNDVTARDVQQSHLQWFRGKSADSYAPIGPWVVTADELGAADTLELTTRVNGEVRQQDNTRNLLFDIPTLIASISQGITLEPGDVIATGTPSGVAWGMDEPRYLEVGDVVEVEIEGIGVLTNTVVEPQSL